MIPVRLKQYLAFGTDDGVIWRDVEVPAIVPGMKFANVFGTGHEAYEVESWEYDAEDDRLVAWLKVFPETEKHFTFEELAEKGEFVGWDTSDFTVRAES